MRYTRTTTGLDAGYDLEAVKDFMRVSGSSEDVAITGMADTAAAEIEAYCELALLTQTITCTTDAWPGQEVTLPVGPVAADATITVHLIETDGTATPVPDGYWLEGGRYPVLHFIGTPGGRLRISYPAGYGASNTDIPADLAHALCDVASRLYDMRGVDTGAPTLPPAAARILARYRRVKA